MYNPSLRLQKKFEDFNHIGIYVRFPDHISTSLHHPSWKHVLSSAPNKDLEYHSLFSLIIEAVCLERLLSSLHELRLENAITYSPSGEIEICELLVEEFPGLRNFGSDGRETFIGLARTFRMLSREINNAFGKGEISEILAKIPLRNPGELLNFAAERLVKRISFSDKERSSHGVSIKFCLDDCEVLSELQRKSLITLIRIGRAPISWVVSSVGKEWESGETFIPSQPITDADRRNIPLDSRDASNFEELCQAVVSLRLLFSIAEDPRDLDSGENVLQLFPLSERLGTQTVNGLLHQIISKSNRPLAQQIFRAARNLALSVDELPAPRKGKRRTDDANLPYYEAYTLLHWREGERNFSGGFGDSDIERIGRFASDLTSPAFSAWLRRKQQNALLQISRALSVSRLPLEGANNIIMLADGSIRDFLEIMGDVFEAYSYEKGSADLSREKLSEFAGSRTKISRKIQSRGIYEASNAYFRGISNRSDLNTDLTARLVSGLGHLTSWLQSKPGDPRVLSSAERGVFIVNFHSFEGDRHYPDDKNLHFLIEQAELAGYLRFVDIKSLKGPENPLMSQISPCVFRLHRRFAPNFRFSVRGAYEPVRVSSDDLAALCFRGDALTPAQWAEQVVVDTSGGREAQQMFLPLGKGYLDEK
ncbi:hypothetical protein [Tritonibacter sp. SIMBA_163]|uniref:ORC-CDC6 family AAA ATPase n=1 Tax=Tritonibacter sp. SIMBA_163 TaxID=3080868 RepID=UPI00397FC588